MSIQPSKLWRFLVAYALLLTMAISSVFAQDDWINYVAMREKGVMALALDLSLDLNRPNYKNLLVLGTNCKDCMSNGFPTEKGLEDIYAFSDSTAISVSLATPSRLAGYVTYQCMAFDIYYVKDTVGLRDHLTKLMEKNFSDHLNYMEIKHDKNWSYYYDFLYPGNFYSEFLIDQAYLSDLVLLGDDLQGLRKVHHWIYFKSLKKRNLLGEKLKKLNFSLDSIAYKKARNYPFQLTISRQDSILPNNIYNLTSMLRMLSGSVGAQYDGWSTELKKSD